jgi:hypothetical protein
MFKLATVTIKNFLNFLLYHDVCPEHAAGINAARKSCDIAHQDLWRNHRFASRGPGDFNTSCSRLFGGCSFELRNHLQHHDESHEPHPVDAPDAPENAQPSSHERKFQSSQQADHTAQTVAKFTLAGAGTNDQAVAFRDLSNTNQLAATQVPDIDGFEVLSFDLPNEQLQQFYQRHAPSGLHPVGILRAKPYRDPAKSNIDLSPDERTQWENDGAWENQRFTFLVEKDLLQFCYPGMKVITSVWQLNCGVDYFDEVRSAYSSIYTVLCNDLMMGWKKPRPVLSASEKEKLQQGLHQAANGQLPAQLDAAEDPATGEWAEFD